jgi:two-component system, sporulation sensor kinase E
MVKITDDGYGIPKERLKKIGEPFYTTKEKGTGLGLMVSYRIIKNHKGSIVCESEEGKGTTFIMTFPKI